MLFKMYYKARLGNPFTCSQDPPPPSFTLETYIPGVYRRAGQYFLHGKGEGASLLALAKHLYKTLE